MSWQMNSRSPQTPQSPETLRTIIVEGVKKRVSIFSPDLPGLGNESNNAHGETPVCEESQRRGARASCIGED